MGARLTLTTWLTAALALSAPALAAPSDKGRGPYRVVMETNAGLPRQTVYRPANLSAFGKTRLPIFVWGNGGCDNVSNRYRNFLTDIASRGYLVLALGRPGPRSVEHSWPEENPTLPAGPIDVNAPANSYPEDMTQAIDWAVAQNGAANSPLKGRIDTGKIAVAGHSCGGLQALTLAASDPRITTTLMLNSGVWGLGSGGLPGAAKVTKESLKQIHGSIALINGETDVALPNARDDFARLSGVPAFRADRKGVAHSGTYWLPHGGAFSTVTAAWLDWQLKGDARAGRWFTGADCRLCADPRWTVQRKNIP
jgi:dienelactone hydrolase